MRAFLTTAAEVALLGAFAGGAGCASAANGNASYHAVYPPCLRLGGSYLCTAVVGYDGPTGLGTPIGTSGF